MMTDLEQTEKTTDPNFVPDLKSYDKIIVGFSGGKDSIACFLRLLDEGVNRDRIELWHHEIDGREGSELMDWACTRGYCEAFARDFGVKLYFSWKEGGFEREMLRADTPTAPTIFEKPDGTLGKVGGKGPKNTRRKFPQVSADLSTRWCSAYLKISVCGAAIANQPRFENKRTLVITGERAQESAARAKYNTFEPDRADNRNGKRVVRHVDRWRPIHGWEEEKVWAIIEKHRVRCHPAYYLGWGRVSCAACIFGSANQFASLAKINPEQVEKVASYEEEFGVTIKRKESVRELTCKGKPYESMKAEDMLDAKSKNYDKAIIMEEGEWTFPAGAFGESCGPL
jgi:3'-phosphoadenosine 5'-phosphosulfate sulfotransferase (PAPS reductase)/FAD synthetase